MRLSILSVIQSTILVSLLSNQVLAAVPLARDSSLARRASTRQCDSICGQYSTEMNGCDGAAESCPCTSSIASTLQSCIDCTVSLASSNAGIENTVIETDQQSASLYMQLCPAFTITVAGKSVSTDNPTILGASSTTAGKPTSTGTAGPTTSAVRGSSASTTSAASASGTKSTSGAVSFESNFGSGSHLVVVSGLVWAMGIILAV